MSGVPPRSYCKGTLTAGVSLLRPNLLQCRGSGECPPFPFLRLLSAAYQHVVWRSISIKNSPNSIGMPFPYPISSKRNSV